MEKLNTHKSRNPSVVVIIRQVDGGRAVIGSIDCPHCGKEHLTTNISCGRRRVYCGVDESTPDGYNFVVVQSIQ